MAMTIRAEQRDAIYEEVVADLGAVGDIFLLLSRQDWEAARRHRCRFEEDMRLLDDLGWEAEQPGDEFVLTMPPAALARVLRRLTDNVAATLHQFVVLPLEEREQVQRALVAQAAYSDLLAQLSEGTATAAVERGESS